MKLIEWEGLGQLCRLLRNEVLIALASQPDAGIQDLMLDASRIDDVDDSAAKALPQRLGRRAASVSRW